MDTFSRIFIRGLITLLPIAVTIYIVYSAVVILDSLLGSLLRLILPTYIPGLGLMGMLVLIFIFGLLLNSLLASRILSYAEKKFLEVPLMRAVYSPLRDLMNLFTNRNHKNLQQVVFVKIGNSEATAMGLVTRENFQELKLGKSVDGKVAVFFPFSYGLGGYTILVPRNQIEMVNIPIEKAMSLAITGWVKAEAKNETKNNESTERLS